MQKYIILLLLILPFSMGDLQNLNPGATPEQIKHEFTNFVNNYFIPNSKIDRFLGNFQIDEWIYESKYGVCVGISSSIPGISYIEYGLNDNYGMKTKSTDRHYNHLHFISGLEPETEYHYRSVFTDYKGGIHYSNDKTFNTLGTEITEIDNLPYTINNPGYYLVTKNLTASTTGIEIASNDVILDLGGNTIVHQSSTFTNDIANVDKAGVGVYVKNVNNIKIFNGKIIQASTSNRPYTSGTSYPGGLNSIYMYNVGNVEIGGVYSEYHTAQTHGFYLRKPKETYDIHHNVIYDLGWEVINRHGDTGGRSIYLKEAETGENDFSIHHNLIKRTRQNAIQKAQFMYDNEIYVDSWATNSFAIGPNSAPDVKGGEIYNNKIFLTGYHAIGISWAHLDLDVHNNLIHMESIDTGNKRWWEDFGDQNSLNGLRITNYGSGGQVRDNLTYANNLIIGNLRDNCEMRGTELYSDYSISNVKLENTIVDIRAESGTQGASVVTHGTPNENHQVLSYINNTLISDICNIRFGDYYGKGYNHHFINTTIEKTGSNEDYHTLIFDGAYTRWGHVLQDCNFLGGARYDDIYWKRTGSGSSYSVKWTLKIHTPENAQIKIIDSNGETEYSGLSDGVLNIPLTMATIRPIEWSENGNSMEVQDKLNHQKIMHTPHTIIMDYQGKETEIEVNMDKQKEIDFTGEIIQTTDMVDNIIKWKNTEISNMDLKNIIEKWNN